MFGRQRQESENSELFPNNNPLPTEMSLSDDTQEMIRVTASENQEGVDASPEVVTIVEKISGILSPYFIVLVGLFLYKSNVFLGTILILVGILSLLNISWQDMINLWEKIQKTLNTNETDFSP